MTLNAGSAEELLRRLAEEWESVRSGEVRDLYLVGGSALLLHFGGSLGTKDVDFAVGQDEKVVLEKVLGDFVRGGKKVGPDGVHVEFVHDAFAPMPRRYRQRAELDRRIGSLNVYRLHPVDIVLSKIGRFGGKDRRDIETIILNHADRLDAETMRSVFEEQFYFRPDLAEERRPRLERIVAFLEGAIDRI